MMQQGIGLRQRWSALAILMMTAWMAPTTFGQDGRDSTNSVRLSTQPSHYRQLPAVLGSGGGLDSPHSVITPTSEVIRPAHQYYGPMQHEPDYLVGDDCGCDVQYELPCGQPERICPDLWGFRFYGWLDLGLTVNDRSPASRYNGPLGFNDRDAFQANQAYFVLDRPVDRSGLGWSLGGRLDVLFGSDYVFTEQVGWEQTQTGADQWNSRAQYGVSTPQAYVEVANGGLSAKFGRFYSLIGYESVMAPDNFFHSHSNALVHGSPRTHTGAVATVSVFDTLSISSGAVNGWDRFDGVSDPMGFLGGFRFRPRHDLYTVSGAVVADDAVGPISGLRDTRVMYSLLFTADVTERLQVAVAHDLGLHQNAVSATQDAEWYGITQYTYYMLNDCWSLGSRFEWFRDDDGARVRGRRAGNPLVLGHSGNFYAATMGLNWSPHTNLRVRPELRWDWFDGATNPFDDNTQREQFTFAIDAIVRF